MEIEYLQLIKIDHENNCVVVEQIAEEGNVRDYVMATIEPVSYTHLDVYKRQHLIAAAEAGEPTISIELSKTETYSCLLYTSRCV